MKGLKVGTLAVVTTIATMLLSVGTATVAHANDTPAAIPAGSYSVDLPGGGTLGFDVAADGTISVTIVPAGLTASAPTITDEGFKVTLNDATGTISRLVEVQVESENGQVKVKAEEEVDQGDQQNGNDQGSSVDNQSGDQTQVEQQSSSDQSSSDGGDGSASLNGSDSGSSSGDLNSGSSGSGDSGSNDSSSATGSTSGGSSSDSGGGDH